RSDVRAESAYNAELPGVIDALRTQGLLSVSEGAQCVFLDEFVGKDGAPLPAIVQKSDGGYLYATTDLAAVRYRTQTLAAQRILYFVDARQNLHLKQVFAIARRAGFAPAECAMEHLPFGTMMGEDGKPFKTRSGGTVKLVDLLDEAEQRAYVTVREKNPDLSEGEWRAIARSVGVAAVKYADLSKNRIHDYIFNWDQILALEGNTAPYLLYAYTRIASIFRKGELGDAHLTGRIDLQHPTERALALLLLRFSETVEAVGAECFPNLLCNYVYELSGAFMQFYEACPVLKADDAIRGSRLLLCHHTAAVLRRGLELLGIEVIEQM
ncbi:MAG: arginine--tRNA ligase, partial [Gammaproteobacteria bacterium]|nr:arginine--tRNA ligase [Gammaproteobacteria bacterium]